MSTRSLRLLNICCLSISLGYACANDELPPYGVGVPAESGGTGATDAGLGGTDDTSSGGTSAAVSTTDGEMTMSATTTAGGNDAASGSGGTGGTETEGSGGSGGSNEATSAGGTGAQGSGGAAGAGDSDGSSGGTTSSTDRDAFFGDSRCTDEFELCEGFEAESLNTDIWSVRGPAPTIDDTRAARGSRSAHFHTVDNGLSYIEQTVTFPASDNRYFGRMFVYFDSMPTAPQWAHWSLAGANGSGTDAEIRVGGQYDNVINRFGVGSDYGPTGDWTILDDDPAGSPREVPVREWICVEWLHDGSAHETRFYWDGVEHTSLFTSADDHGGDDAEQYLLPEFESVWVGWWLYQPDTEPGEFDVWIDEVVFDDERVGCER